MKKYEIVNLIKCFADHNDSGFRTQAAEIANEFNSQGDQDLSEYIMSLIATNDIFVPQMINDDQELKFCTSPTKKYCYNRSMIYFLDI